MDVMEVRVVFEYGVNRNIKEMVVGMMLSDIFW